MPPENDPEPDEEREDLESETTDPDSGGGEGLAGVVGVRMPAGFAQSLLPNVNDLVGRIVAPWQEQMQERLRSLLPDPDTYARKIMEPLSQHVHEQMKSMLPDMDDLVGRLVGPLNEQVREQMASITASLPSFSTAAFDLPSVQGLVLGPATEGFIKQISEQHAQILEGFRKSLGPLFDPEALRGINRALLPPNLREHADEVHAHDVHEFLEEEGIPLYLVPRGRTALRLLGAKDRAARRRVLGDCYESLIEDCASVLEGAGHEAVRDDVRFALDGLGAMRAGHTRSAQAMFTVTLDTLIYRFHPETMTRKAITNRKKGAGVPDTIEEMGVREALVWLPIWNAHEQFWKDKGDRVPHYYSRHASVHGVSSRQFNKRNCVQVLMLVTSLIGYADATSPAR